MDNIRVVQVQSGQNELLRGIEILAKASSLERVRGDGSDPESTGFLVSTYFARDFCRFIEEGQKLLVALDPKDTLLGYFLATRGTSFLERHAATRVAWRSDLSLEQIVSDFDSGNFCYLDQIGIEPAFRGKGVAALLLDKIHRSCQDGELLLGAVLQRPVQNVRSRKFFLKMGYAIVGVAHSPAIGGLTDVESVLVATRSKKEPC